MSYKREIPRDLFNEANLLKCHGRLYLELERGNYPEANLLHWADRVGFAVEQDWSDGSIYLTSVQLFVRGSPCNLRRHLNARGDYPLMLRLEDDEEIEVFTDAGNFTEEMKTFLKGDGA